VDGLPGRNSSGYEGLLDPVQLVKLALKGGNARGALRHGYRIVRHALHAYSTHVTVPEQLVAVQILLTPFQDPDRCDTMCCLVLTRPMRRRELIALMGGSGGRSRCAQQSPQEYALL
jgi:hypothetical protein